MIGSGLDKDALDSHITGNYGEKQFEKLSYEEIQDSLEVRGALLNIKKTLEKWSLDTDNALIDDQDRVDLSKTADQVKLILDKVEEQISDADCCLEGGEPLRHVSRDGMDIEYICDTHG